GVIDAVEDGELTAQGIQHGDGGDGDEEDCRRGEHGTQSVVGEGCLARGPLRRENIRVGRYGLSAALRAELRALAHGRVAVAAGGHRVRGHGSTSESENRGRSGTLLRSRKVRLSTMTDSR